jgi:hypothetical protein
MIGKRKFEEVPSSSSNIPCPIMNMGMNSNPNIGIPMNSNMDMCMQMPYFGMPAAQPMPYYIPVQPSYALPPYQQPQTFEVSQQPMYMPPQPLQQQQQQIDSPSIVTSSIVSHTEDSTSSVPKGKRKSSSASTASNLSNQCTLPPPCSAASTTKNANATTGSSSKQKVRIPLKDPRRSYAHIFAKAFNTCEREVLKYCLSKYCIEDCTCVYKYVGLNSPYGADHVKILGTDAILKFWEVLFLSMPDAVFEIQEHKMKVLTNGSCAIVAKFIFHATKVYYMSTDHDQNALIYLDKAQATTQQQTLSPIKIEPKVGETETGKKNEHPQPDESQDQTQVNENAKDQGGVTSTKPVVSKPRVLCNSTLKGTNNPSPPVIPLMPSMDQLNLNSMATSPDIPNPSRAFGLGASIPRPQVLIIIGTFTCFVNVDKKIYKFEFIHSVKEENSIEHGSSGKNDDDGGVPLPPPPFFTNSSES